MLSRISQTLKPLSDRLWVILTGLTVMIACAFAVGCARQAESPPPPLVDTSPDEKALLALDSYDPMYQVNAEGRVIRIRLVNTHLPPSAMAEIGKMTEIVQLDFYGSTVTDEGLAQLKDLQKLRHMGLGGTQISEKGLVHLERLDSLVWVWLPTGRISKGAIEKLKTARPDLNVG